jgi:hypothetical protein
MYRLSKKCPWTYCRVSFRLRALSPSSKKCRECTAFQCPATLALEAFTEYTNGTSGASPAETPKIILFLNSEHNYNLCIKFLIDLRTIILTLFVVGRFVFCKPKSTRTNNWFVFYPWCFRATKVSPA